MSPVPLDEEVRGIDILSYGIWHVTTLAGIENKERSNYIFGQIDVPVLEDGDWPIPAFDNTRNNTLNPQNPIVAVLLGWISEELEKIRSFLVEKDRERRRSETAKQLAEEAEKIANLLNEDFLQQEMELELARRISKRSGGRSVNEILDAQGELWPGDGNKATPWEQTGHPRGGSGTSGQLAGSGDTPRPGPTARSGNEPGEQKSMEKGRLKQRRAVFSIEYEHATTGQPRTRYAQDKETIFINLDHPQIANAFEAGGRRTDARQFREICYEVAAIEYAIILQHKRLEETEQDANEALYDVRETINRLTTRFGKILMNP